MSTNLEQRIKLQFREAENEAKKLEIEAIRLSIEAIRLSIEAKRLEVEAKKENTILWLTINEWVKAVDAGGGFLFQSQS